MKTKYLYLCFLFLTPLSALCQKIVPILKDSYLTSNVACPNTDYEYWINTDSNYGKYEWKITGSSFRYSRNLVKEINAFYVSSVTVIWDNVKSVNGSVPKGNITLKVYNTHDPKNVLVTGNLEQKIKSLNDLLPDNLVSVPENATIPRGIQTVKVYLKTPLNFPGIEFPNGMPVPVTIYEWKIPSGWNPKTGESPSSSGTYYTDSPVIELTTDENSEGDVIVRGVNDCPSSNDFSAYSWPIKLTRSGLMLGDYPKTVPFNESNTYTFSVSQPSSGTFEWRAPIGWKINGGGNILVAGNTVSITTGTCYTEEKVQVGLYTNGEVTNLTNFPTIIVPPSINIPTGEIIQYQNNTFSLNIPNDNIESVEWFVNDLSVGTVTNSSTLIFPINISGKVTVSAKLIISGCSAFTIPEVEVDVTKAPDIAIGGSSTICHQETYNLLNLPPTDISVQWTTSPNITIISGQGTSSALLSKSVSGNYGQGTISADVLLNGTSIAKATRIIDYVGTPVVTSVSGQGYVNAGESASYTANPSIIGSDIQYKWYVFPSTVSTSAWNNTNYITFHQAGTYNVSCQIISQCGSGTAAYTTVTVTGSGGYRVYSNPSTNLVTVKIPEDTEIGVIYNQNDNKKTVSDNYEIQLWNSAGILRSFFTTQKTYQFSVSHLPNGLYFVHIIQGDKIVYRKQFLKN